jgi:hypothetical protein
VRHALVHFRFVADRFGAHGVVEVEKVSSMLEWAGETIAMMQVLVWPPREPWRRCVSFDSL